MRIMHDDGDYSEVDLEVEHPKDHAAGPTAVAVSMKRALEPDGRAPRTAQTLLQAQPGRRLRLHELRLARSGGRAPARRRVLRERRQGGRRGGHPRPRRPGVLRRAQHRRPGRASPSYWLGQQGRITQPMVKRPGATHYEPIDWDEAFALIGERAATRWPARTRRSSTPPAGPPTRRRSPTSSSSARSAPTTCPTARTCATSRPASRWPKSIGIGKASGQPRGRPRRAS